MLAFVMSVFFSVAMFSSTSGEGSKSLDDILTEISSLETQMESFNKILETMESKIESLDETIESKIESLDETIESKIESLDETIESKIESLDKKIENQHEVILDKGNRQDVLNNPCLTAQYLNESWRHIDYIDRGDKSSMCDKRGNSQSHTHMLRGWFRFGPAAGSRLPTFRAPEPSLSHDKQICGADQVAYIAHGGHPTQAEGIVTREVCFQRRDSYDMNSDCYGYHENADAEPIKIAACSDENGEYYVYELQPVKDCSAAYCALDEKTKICPEDTPVHCKSGAVYGRHYKCIAINYRCNGRLECLDGSDEEDCQNYECDPDKYFQCESGECIGLDERCNLDIKNSGCVDGSDERNCTDHVCPADIYQCKSGHCLNEVGRCDGEYDCEDQSDEENCQDHVCVFPESQFQCKNGVCIPKGYRCNGDSDCVDNSDEEDCQDFVCEDVPVDYYGYTIGQLGLFQCNSGQCITWGQRCDGFDNCSDKSDEENCEYDLDADGIQDVEEVDWDGDDDGDGAIDEVEG